MTNEHLVSLTRYGVRVPVDEAWAYRLAEKLRAARLPLEWIRGRQRLDVAQLLARHPAIRELAAQVDAELGAWGGEDEMYWAACNTVYDRAVALGGDFPGLAGRCQGRALRLRARP